MCHLVATHINYYKLLPQDNVLAGEVTLPALLLCTTVELNLPELYLFQLEARKLLVA
jgi:hypothetical protein